METNEKLLFPNKMSMASLAARFFYLKAANLLLENITSSLFSFQSDPPQRNPTFSEERRDKYRKMKLVWSPETSAKAYIDTIKTCKLVSGSGEAELISAMAGGWNPKLIAEAWSQGNSITTSIGLAIAANHLGARHVCIVPDEQSRLAYIAAMQSKGSADQYLPEIVVGKAEEVVEELTGIEFLVVDGQRKEFCRVVRASKLSHRGAVLVCRNCSLCNMAGFRWSRVLNNATRVVRSLILPVGKGLDIAYVSSNGANKKTQSRWIVHIDPKSGEEHVFRG